jgi:31-O-methyltransferase
VTPIKRLPNGLAVTSINNNETEYLYKEIFVDKCYLPLGIPELPESPIIFDVGANIGLFSLFSSQVWPRAKVFAFEPAPAVFAVLEENTKSLDCVSVHNLALGDSAGSRDLTYYPKYSMMSGFYADPEADKNLVKTYMRNSAHHIVNQRIRARWLSGMDTIIAGRFATEKVSCQTTTLTAAMQLCDVPHIDFLKIDVEGAELEVLKGIDEAKWPSISNVAVEVIDRDGELAAIENLFCRHKLKVSRFQHPDYKGSNLHMVYAALVQ